MPKPCSVCSHLERATIDMRLAVQVVNVAQLAREYGIGKDAMHSHRRKHLPRFLPAFAAQAQPLEPGTIAAEAQRLYLTTLDNLAQAEAGTLVGVDADGTQTRVVSNTAIARFIREARAGLDLLHKLSVASGASNPVPDGVDKALDERIAVALEKVAARHTLPTIDGVALEKGNDNGHEAEYAVVIDAELVEDNALALYEGNERMRARADAAHVPGLPWEVEDPDGAGRQDPHTPGPSPAAAAPAHATPKESQIGRDHVEHAREQTGHVAPDGFDQNGPVTDLSAAAQALTAPTPYKERVWNGNPAASDEERRAAGFQPIPLSFPRPES